MAFLPDNTGLQQLINQSTESAQKGIGSAFDTAYQLRLQEQGKAKEVFDTLVKTLGDKAPGLVALVAAQNPQLLTSLTQTPALFERGAQRQGPQPSGKAGAGRVQPAPLGEQVSGAFARAQSGMAPATKEAEPNEVRLALEAGTKMISNAVANGAEIKDPQAFLNGWSKAILDGRLPGPKDVGLDDASFAKVISTPEAKHLDALTELHRLFQDEHGRPPTFDETRSLIAMVLPGTDENTIALTQALRETAITGAKINNQRASEALNDARNGQKLTLGQMTDAQNYIKTNKPIVETLQRLDNLWDAAVHGDKKAREDMLLLVPTLWTDAETRGAAAEIGSGRFSDITRKELSGVVARRIPALNVYEQAIAVGRQPRGGTSAVAPAAPVNPAADIFDELSNEGVIEK